MSDKLNEVFNKINEQAKETKAEHLKSLIKDANFDVKFYEEKLEKAHIKLNALQLALDNLNVLDG